MHHGGRDDLHEGFGKRRRGQNPNKAARPPPVSPDFFRVCRVFHASLVMGLGIQTHLVVGSLCQEWPYRSAIDLPKGPTLHFDSSSTS